MSEPQTFEHRLPDMSPLDLAAHALTCASVRLQGQGSVDETTQLADSFLEWLKDRGRS